MNFQRSLHAESLHDTSALHIAFSTGSPLPPDTFRWIYECVNDDICVASISGGTDIIGCFIGACHLMPIYDGECQSAMLGT